VSPQDVDAPVTRACRSTLEGWAASSAEQERLRQLFLSHLDEHGDGWRRTRPGSHLTASGLICAPDEQQVLLTLHAKIGRWLQTGGHLDDDDAGLADAALRESREESGLGALTLDPVPLLLSRHLVSCGGAPTYHHDVQYLVLAPRVVAPTLTEESLDLRWFARADLPDEDDSVLDLVSAASARLGWT
jgi:8-oxo-dGTP pyrophosphatase MutT (NUDIX family)